MHCLFMKSIWQKVGHKQHIWTMKNVSMLTKIYLQEFLKIIFCHLPLFSQRTHFSLHRTTKKFLAFIKAIVYAFVISTACALFDVDWLANFQSWANLTGLLKFHKGHSEILLTTCANQLLYNWSLFKLCSACTK